MCLLSIPVSPGEWFCSSCQGWPGLCSPLDSPEVIPLFPWPNQSPNEEANTLSSQRAGAAFPSWLLCAHPCFPGDRLPSQFAEFKFTPMPPHQNMVCWKTQEQVPNLPAHTQTAGISLMLKKRNLNNFKNNYNKRLNHAKSYKRLPQVLFSLCDRVPVLSLGGTATVLFTSSFSASLANSPLQLFGYFLIQGLHWTKLYPLPEVTPTPVVYHSWTRGWKYYTFENSLETAFFKKMYLSTELLLCVL